jgi:3-hydroxyisobutyrate dehydrogenase-like beta-hydroxyacid dehydrogenase
MSAGHVALIGAGRMGLGLTRNLLAHGRAVCAFDVSEAALRRVAELGARTAASIAEAVTGAAFVITCLPDVATVRAAYFGDAGILAAAPAGALCAEMTSSDSLLTQEIGAAAAARTIALVDAPMLRGAPEAWAGTVHVLLGGSAADKARATPLLAEVSERIIDAGELGAAHALKALNNAVTMANNAVLAEAMMAGRRLGFTPELITEVLAGGLATSRILELYAPRFLSGEHPPTAAISIGEKDLGIFLATAGRAGAPIPVLTAAHATYRAACEAGHGALPPSRLAELLDPDGANDVA